MVQAQCGTPAAGSTCGVSGSTTSIIELYSPVALADAQESYDKVIERFPV